MDPALGLERPRFVSNYDRFYGNGLYGKIPTKKEPIRTFLLTSRLSRNIIIPSMALALAG